MVFSAILLVYLSPHGSCAAVQVTVGLSVLVPGGGLLLPVPPQKALSPLLA